MALLDPACPRAGIPRFTIAPGTGVSWSSVWRALHRLRLASCLEEINDFEWEMFRTERCS